MKLSKQIFLICGCIATSCLAANAGTDELVTQLISHDGTVRIAAQKEITLLPPSVKEALAQSLLQMIEDAAKDHTLQNLDNASYASEAFGSLGSSGVTAVPTLINLLSSPDDDATVSWVASFALAQIGSAAVSPLLQVFQNYNNGNQTLFTARALGGIRPPALQAIPLLESLLTQSHKYEINEEAKKALRRMGSEGVKALYDPESEEDLTPLEPMTVTDQEWIHLLNSPNPADRMRSCEWLGKSNFPVQRTAVNLLGKLITTDPDPDVRQTACHSIMDAARGTTLDIPYLIQALQDPFERVQTAASGMLYSEDYGHEHRVIARQMLEKQHRDKWLSIILKCLEVALGLFLLVFLFMAVFTGGKTGTFLSIRWIRIILLLTVLGGSIVFYYTFMSH